MDAQLRCPACKESKPESAFARSASRKSGRQSQCRDCRAVADKRWYAGSGDAEAVRRRQVRAATADRNHAWVMAHLLAHPCTDCGVADVRVLEFDHLGDKDGDVAFIVQTSSLARVQREVAKCEVVCANCHKVRTRARAKDYRHLAWLARSDASVAGVHELAKATPARNGRG